ncbi:MAG: Photosystem II manganese-stabilizing polypeptide [Chroococcidiopsis sp. SAG 2025]|uniref:photosystem II manganese-stabilizing polypeptide n=1 Tax=Chroococcidiopsis sp. SAG 2025 TaxID=171389 RepID=UPI0029373AA3|nr:photosystem II manganese-stabilizing polypeptide [Chroococcidiopsis sp. SAG 2025]MDV2991292.1 Photosystem II manganese-stabilizing polypeptide [Chroococcidiopsis sp. SAG 2025]
MKYRALIVAFLALCLGFLTACSNPSEVASRELLTYEQIRGTGLANKCPQLSETSRGSIAIDPDQSYRMVELCLEPTSFFIKEEPVNKRQEAEYIAGKLLTRYTSTIDQVQGDLKVNPDKSLTFVEKDGLDFQAITVQLPGGERVPFLFTIKDLVAQTQPGLTSINTSTDFEGKFNVPSYRTANFLDPKGRGVTTGYDNAVALPASADKQKYANVKSAGIENGSISLQVAKVDNNTGEVAGTFESVQPSDTDMGAKEALDVKVRGLFYARIEPQA